jgi:serine/threonine protein kinase
MLRCGHVSTELLGPSGTPPLTSLITGCSMVAIAMEYYPNGSLDVYIIQNQPPLTTILNILCDVVYNSYRAYSIARFCHGDLFTKNILLDIDIGIRYRYKIYV